MCGRRKIEREYPEIATRYGDMDFDLVRKIAEQLPPGIVVQLHNNGEPLLYPRIKDAIHLFEDQITGFDTNGKLLLDKAEDIIGNLDTLTISVIENDPEGDEQYEIIKKFIKKKGDNKPYTVLRLNGDVDAQKYEKLSLLLVRRILHSPMGSYNYKKKDPTIPEIGVCLDFLHHLSVNHEGKVSICVRFDPEEKGAIGDVRTQTLDEIWWSGKRMRYKDLHLRGKRDEIELCSQCHFWGVPTGVNSVR